MHILIHNIVQENALHARWLNTLSFLENAGARKISACEDETLVGMMQLKHAAEEHRHAYYLKKQITKLTSATCPTFSNPELLAPVATRQYLKRLDLQCSRYLKSALGLQGSKLRYAAYLFVTYTIEIRADHLYPVYQSVLSSVSHRVTVKSIIAEEEGHLQEMSLQLQEFSGEWQKHAKVIQAMEQDLFEQWLAGLKLEVVHE